MVPKLGVMGKKRSLCKIQSNFNRRDKILPNNVQLGPDSAAADTFITMDKETLRPVKLYFLPPVLVVTKFTSDRQCEQPKDELVLGAAVPPGLSGWFRGKSVLSLCLADPLGLLLPFVCYPVGSDFKKRTKYPTLTESSPNQDLNIFEDWPLSAKKTLLRLGLGMAFAAPLMSWCSCLWRHCDLDAAPLGIEKGSKRARTLAHHLAETL